MYQLPNQVKSMLVKTISPHLVLQHVKVVKSFLTCTAT